MTRRVSGIPEVALIGVSLGSGGAEKQLVILANHIASMGGHPLVLTLIDDTHRLGDLHESVRYECLGLEAGSRNLRHLAVGFRRARQLVQTQGPDVLVSFTDPANQLGWALRASGISAHHILSERNSYLGGWSRVHSRRLLYMNAALVVPNTSAAEEAILHHRLVNSRRVQVVPNAIDVPDEIPERKSDGAFRWICVARLTEQKDIPTLLLAVSRLESEGHTLRLSIVGRGEQEEHLKGLSHGLGLDRTVSFQGESDAVMSLMTHADAFVLPSRWEGLPNVLLEASASGLPIVATDVGGVRETMPASNHSMLVPASSPGSLAAAMAEVMDLPDSVLAAIGRANYQFVRSHFETQTVLRRWGELLANPEQVV